MTSTRKLSAAALVTILIAASLGVGFKSLAGMGHTEEITVFAGVVPQVSPTSADAEEQPPTV